MENLLKLFELLGNVLPENNTDKNRLLSELIANLLTAVVTQKTIRPEFTPPIPQDCTNAPVPQPEGKKSRILKFTQSEINSMPKKFRNYFIANNTIITYRIVNNVYQARYHRGGVNIDVASKDFDIMKRKMIAKLNEIFGQNPGAGYPGYADPASSIPSCPDPPEEKHYPSFGEFVKEWLEIRKRKNKSSTYKDYCDTVRYMLPAFGETAIDKIDRKSVQTYLNNLTDAGKFRSAQKARQVLFSVFELAKADFGFKNPVESTELPYYEAQHCIPLTKEEERKLIDYCIRYCGRQGTSALLVLLFFGLRKGELASLNVVHCNGHDYLRVVTGKGRKGAPEKIREIPFTPVMRRFKQYIDFHAAQTCSDSTLFRTIKDILPNHHVHELRSTFISRVKECNVNLEIVMVWDGHTQDRDVASSKVDRIYTKYSEEYIWSEALKVNYSV